MLPPLRSQSDAVFYPGMWLSLFIGMQLEKISLAGRHFSGGDVRLGVYRSQPATAQDRTGVVSRLAAEALPRCARQSSN